MRVVTIGTGLAAVFTVLGVHFAPVIAPDPTASTETPDIDPCLLISYDQAKQIRSMGRRREDGKAEVCIWSTNLGGLVIVTLEKGATTVEGYVASLRKRVANLTVSPWAGERHRGAALDYGDGRNSAVVITISPTRIATVSFWDGGQDRIFPKVLPRAAAIVDRNLPA